MIFLVLFLNLFAKCETNVNYVKTLSVYQEGSTTTYEYYIKGHMNFDDVIYKELYFDKIVWYDYSTRDYEISTLIKGVNKEYMCEGLSNYMTAREIGRMLRNCICEFSGLHYLLEKYIEIQAEQKNIYR